MKESLVISIFFISGLIFGQNLIANSTGSFIYLPQAPLNRPPVEVFYHIPNGDITTMPVLMSFHGANRDGDNYRNYWINMANAHGFMIFAPEFTTANYPGLGDDYLMANIFDDGDNPSSATFNSQNEWTISILDPLFDYIITDISGVQDKYNAWGHSGGAQFLHRFVTYLPNSKLNRAVCSNAGWYTVPENTVSFPYGILNGELPNEDLISAFSKKLIVHLGQNDNDPNSGLRRNAIVDVQQGIHRLERGQYYFNTSENTAQNMMVSFNWEKHEVPGVGHDAQLMANDALQYLQMNVLSNNRFSSNTVVIFPNPSKDGIININGLNNNEYTLEIFDLSGKRLAKFNRISNMLTDFSYLDSGIYLLKISNDTNTLVQKIVIE